MSAFHETRPDDDVAGHQVDGCHVLVVDDNRVNQNLLRRCLEREGVSVVVVGDGESALHAVTGEAFDAVLMDLTMPVMNGLDATRSIRALAMGDAEDRLRFASLPIIGISAHAMVDEFGELLACGKNDAVPKPIRQETLLAKLATSILQQDQAALRVHLPLGHEA